MCLANTPSVECIRTPVRLCADTANGRSERAQEAAWRADQAEPAGDFAACRRHGHAASVRAHGVGAFGAGVGRETQRALALVQE